MSQLDQLGPDSLLWRWAGDNRIGFLGPTIGLLQLMHPAIGAGVLEHSDFFRDPYGRIERSLPRILGAVYDGPGAASTGRTVRNFHRTITGVDDEGRRYHALDPETFWWAHATFQFMAEQVVDRFDSHRLTPVEREQLYTEGIEWYHAYGVSDRAVPVDRAAFGAQWDRYCAEVLEMNPAVEWVLEAIFHPRELRLPRPLRYADPIFRIPAVRRLAFEPVRVAAIGGLPAVVRTRFGIPWSWRDQLELEALELAVQQGWRFVPPSARWHPRPGRMATGAGIGDRLGGLMPRRRPSIGLAPLVAGMAFDGSAVGDVLDAAEALLRTYGLRRWSMDDVADRAAVGRTSLYRQFESRDALVHAVLARELRRTFAAIAAVVALHDDLEDKVVEAGLVALAALRGSVVEQLLRSDPATFLPFLTTGAGPLLAIAREHILAGARGLGLALDGGVAEIAARLGLSFVLTRDTVLPVEDDALARQMLHGLVRPLLHSLTA